MSDARPDLLPIELSQGAAAARLAAVLPEAYALTRNALDGAVTGLSPFITHGIVTLPEVLAGVAARHPIGVQHTFVRELGWREFFRHVWQREGDRIFASLHDGPLPDAGYAGSVPADVREARTGVPAIDQAVRTLHATGLLHNHARLWLASYLVHVRKVGWRAGADWLYGQLLDGDLASNHLSWQWVAGTGSSKPYLFNADNVARFAPAAWHSAGTVIDVPYEALERIARQPQPAGAPPVSAAPGWPEPAALAVPPTSIGLSPPSAHHVAGRDVWLVHPWALHALPGDLPRDAAVVGVLALPFHRRWPWRTARWAAIGPRMQALTPCWWPIGDGAGTAAAAAALQAARSVHVLADPHIDRWLPAVAQRRSAALFAAVERPCTSFSQWWTRTTRGIADVGSLPGLAALNRGSGPWRRAVDREPGRLRP